MKLIYILFSFLVFFSFALPTYAETTYQLPAPISQQLVDFPNVGSGVSGTPNYDFGYKIPEGTQFDRIQMAVPTSQGTYSKSVYWAIFNNVGTWFYQCPNSSCISDDTQSIQLTQSSHSQPVVGVLEWVFSTTTTITTSSQYFRFVLDPNPSYTDFSYHGTTFSTAYAMNGSNYSKSAVVPSLKFCNGVCDDNNFSPIPNLSTSPWARLISPNSGSTLLGGQTQPLQFQVNTGTSTADNVQIRFSSEIQSLAPYDYTLTQTGINSFTYNLPLPSFEDTIQFIVDVRSGTTSLVTSPDYTINVTTNPNNIDLGLTDSRPSACDNLFVGALCSIAEWLFFPGEISTTFFSSTLDSLNDRKPFSYFSEASDIIQTTASTATTSAFVNLEVTIPIIGTSLPILTKDSLDSIYPTDTRLLIRTVIAYGLWILLILTLLYMLLNIFNKAVYMGEQQQSFDNRVKTKHER